MRACAAFVSATAIASAAVLLGVVPEGRAGEASPHTRLYRDDEMPPFPNVFETSLGEQLTLNGVPIRASLFTTTQVVDRVRDFYVDAFEGRGLVVQRSRAGKGWSLVSADPLSATTRVVAIQQQGNETMVFCAVLPLEASPGRVLPREDPDVPFDEESVGAIDVSSLGDNGGRVVSYEELRPATEVEALLVRALTGRGWVARGRNETRGGFVLRYRRPGWTATVSFRQPRADVPITGVVFQLAREES